MEQRNIRSNIDSTIHTSDTSDRDSWKSMFERFYVDMGALLEKEGRLIKVELSEKFTEVKAASTTLVIGATLLLVGVFALAATTVILLALVMDLWIAASIVTIALLVVGGTLLSASLTKLEGKRLSPRRSVEALGEITTTLKERVHE